MSVYLLFAGLFNEIVEIIHNFNLFPSFNKDSVNPHCAGSIIDDSTILTTAFCVKK